MRPALSVIIPVWNDARWLRFSLARIRGALPGAEVLVVDGGSSDGSPDVARAGGASVLRSTRGRGRQLAAGAAAARSDWLLFVHADTLVPREAQALIERHAAHQPDSAATFGLRFAARSKILATFSWFSRFDTVFTRFGDQGILCSRELYEELGGFPPWPLFEDVEFLRRARQYRPVVRLPGHVVTSARRFRGQAWKVQFRNAGLILRYLLGASPESLARRYSGRAAIGPACGTQ